MSIMLIFDVLILFVLVIAYLSKLTITKCAKVGTDGNWWDRRSYLCVHPSSTVVAHI